MLKRILVVSEDAGVATTRVLLLRANGYNAQSANSDVEALSTIEREDLDLVLVGTHSRLMHMAVRARLLAVETYGLYGERDGKPCGLTNASPANLLAAVVEMVGAGQDGEPSPHQHLS
jgi:hypothetical protein